MSNSLRKIKVAFYPSISSDGIGKYINSVNKFLNNEVRDGPGNILSLKTFFHPVPKGYDIIHVPNFLVPLFKKKSKIVCTIQDVIPLFKENNYNLFKKVYLFLRIWWSLKYSDFIIFTSASTRNDVLSIFGKVGPNAIIPLACDPPIKILEHDHSPVPYKYCLSVGRRRKHKNTEGIIRSFAKVTNNSNLHLIFAGKVDNEDTKWKSLIFDLGLEERVHFVGFLDEYELAIYYSFASSLLFPSHFEGFGLPILEAMSYGCPVITSNTSSMPEVAGDSALLVDPNNYNEIADSIILLEHNLLFRQKLIELGLKNSAKYSWEKVSEDTLKVYTKIIKN